MKFSQLTSNMRSMVAALAASNHLNTDQLGKACSPQINAQQASSTLLELRKQGLVYSMQKPTGTAYASWAITSVGMAVFEGRPDGDVVLTNVPVNNGQAYSPVKPAKQFVIKSASSVLLPECDRDIALAKAQQAATNNPGVEYNVYERIAIAHMPVPQAQITLL